MAVVDVGEFWTMEGRERMKRKKGLGLIGILDWCLLSVAVVTLLVNLFFPVEQLRGLLAIFVALLMGLSFPFLDIIPRMTGLLLFILGATLFIISHVPLDLWISAYSQNLNLLMLLTLVPLLGIPLRYGDYTRHLSRLYHRYVCNPFRLYLLSGVSSLLLSPVLNLAAITLIKELSPRTLTPLAEQALCMSLARTYGLSLSWTPFFGTVILVLSFLNVSWAEIAPITFGFAITVFAISCLLDYRRLTYGEKLFKELPGSLSESEKEWLPSKDNQQGHWKQKIMELVFILVLLVFITIGIHEWFELDMMLGVSLLSIIFPIIWTAYLKKWRHLFSGWQIYIHHILPNIKNEIFLFMNAGFFGGAVVYSGYGKMLPRVLEWLTGDHPLGWIALIGLSIMLFPLIGIHPLVLPLIYAVVLPEVVVPLHLLTITFIILVSWSLTLPISPFSAATLVVIRGTTYSNFRASIGWNWHFALTGYIIMIIFALTLQYILP